jgi:hypothetical protein
LSDRRWEVEREGRERERERDENKERERERERLSSSYFNIQPRVSFAAIARAREGRERGTFPLAGVQKEQKNMRKQNPEEGENRGPCG